MTTEQTPQQTPGQQTWGQESTGESPDWWHGAHSTFIALAGFFSGMLCVTLVPGAYAGILRLLFHYDTAERLFPYVLVILALPVVLVAVPRTRRFGTYMLIGMALTLLVVLGVASLVLYFMVRSQG
ncbi:MAG: hypothetical protein ACRDOX_02380 [Nocardioides sp.]